MILPSYAKLNLYLAVLNKRRDGYHNLRTVFERIALADKITLRLNPGKGINITCDNPALTTDENNLCYRSARLLQDTFRIPKGVDIHINKRIPIGAGLAGGSSNAATVLLGLNRLWRLNLSRQRLVGLGKKIGCDVPFFIYQTPFALGSQRGDKIKPLTGLRKVRLWHLLVVPDLEVATPRIYAEWDRYSGLTKPRYDVNILISALKKNTLGREFGPLFNSLQEVTFRLYPEAARVKIELAKAGLKSILMSGSGPAVFGIVSARKEAISFSRRLQRLNPTWRIYVTKTI